MLAEVLAEVVLLTKLLVVDEADELGVVVGIITVSVVVVDPAELVVVTSDVLEVVGSVVDVTDVVEDAHPPL